MNPFQSPLNMSELDQITELNPDIVLGLQDVKNTINGIDNQVIKLLDDKLNSIDDSIIAVDEECKTGWIDTLDDAGNIIQKCDDEVTSCINGQCDDVDEKLPFNCEKRYFEFDLGHVPSTNKPIVIDRPLDGSKTTSITGRVRDKSGNWCPFRIFAVYCVRKVKGVETYYTCNSFKETISYYQNQPIINISNADLTGELYCIQPVGGEIPNFHSHIPKLINGVIQYVNSSDYKCGDKPIDTIPQPAPLPIPQPTPVPIPIPTPTPTPIPSPPYEPPIDETPKYDDKCPKPCVNVLPAVCPPSTIEFKPNITLQVSNEQIQTQIQSQEQSINVNGDETPAICPDENDIDGIITICADAKIREFLDREQLTPLIPETTIGNLFRNYLIFSNTPFPSSLYRS